MAVQNVKNSPLKVMSLKRSRNDSFPPAKTTRLGFPFDRNLSNSLWCKLGKRALDASSLILNILAAGHIMSEGEPHVQVLAKIKDE